MSKIILIVLDGLSARVAEHSLGYLFALQEAGIASYQRLSSELPSLSRPLYETLLTGRKPIESGILHNHVVRHSQFESVFSLARAAGLTTAAVAYHWVSELYGKTPYQAMTDRFQLNTDSKDSAITHGIFYHLDHYPDIAVLQDADFLRYTYQPDFLLVHTMNIDDAGHKHGGNSHEYHYATRAIDSYLSHFIPLWLADGYRIIVTADHGMSDDGMHGGRHSDERDVPFFAIGRPVNRRPAPLTQTQISAILCASLDIAHPLNNAATDLWTPNYV